MVGRVPLSMFYSLSLCFCSITFGLRTPSRNFIPFCHLQTNGQQTRKHLSGVNLHFGGLFSPQTDTGNFSFLQIGFVLQKLEYFVKTTYSFAAQRNHLRLRNFLSRQNNIPDVPKSRGLTFKQ